VEASLRNLGFAVSSARVGRIVDLELATGDPAEARAQLQRMCDELLANPLIESVEIEVAET
jgi:phosphoribosylformylglycinamidine synthase subunit PurS